MILRTNGQPFASAQSAKSARTKMGLGDSHDVVEYEGGYALGERVGGGAPSREQTPCEKLGYKVGDEFEMVGDHFYFSIGEKAVLADDDGSNSPYFYNRNGNHGIVVALSLVKPLRIILRPGDYVLTEGASPTEMELVEKAFLNAGCEGSSWKSPLGTYPCMGWDIRDNTFYSNSEYFFKGRQLTIAQVLNAVNAEPAEPEQQTEQEPIMQPSLADQLETALADLDDAQQAVDRLRDEYRAAYPLIHGVVEPKKDMSDPANWRAGDLITSLEERTDITKGKQYVFDGIDEDGDYSILKDDDGDYRYLNAGNAEWHSRP